MRGVANRSATADEDLPEDRLVAPGRAPERSVIRANVAPAEGNLPLVADDPIEQGLARHTVAGLGGQAHHPHTVELGPGERDAEPRALAAEERVGHLNEDAGAVAGVRLAPARPAVEEVLQHRQRLIDDPVGFVACDVHHKTHPATIVLVVGVVQPLPRRKIRMCHPPTPLPFPSTTRPIARPSGPPKWRTRAPSPLVGGVSQISPDAVKISSQK